MDANRVAAEERLLDVNKAIENILLGGQSYKLGSRSLTRADLNTLLTMQRDLQAQVANQDTGLMDNTYLGIFEGR